MVVAGVRRAHGDGDAVSPLIGAAHRNEEDVIEFMVFGDPVPQGSHRKSRNGHIISDNPKLRRWRDDVTRMARLAMRGRATVDAPVSVQALFFFKRPKSVPRGAWWKATKPDLDKLCRALGDGLKDAGVIKDDSRIVRWTAEKVFSDAPKLVVTVERLRG